MLLPRFLTKPRLTPSEKEDYFHHFLENRPSGKIDMRSIELGCNNCRWIPAFTPFTYAKTGEVIKGRYTLPTTGMALMAYFQPPLVCDA